MKSPSTTVFRLSPAAIVALSALLANSGCANMNHAESGGLMGTAIGGLAGAAIGAESGNAAAGAIIGGITGAVAGTAIGDSEDAREERDLAIAQRNGTIAQAQYQAQQQAIALSNFDLIRLVQSGVSDDVIVNMIRTRGGKFELNTEAIIALKNNGVSDRVIVAAQQAPQVAPPAPMQASGEVIVVQQEPRVVVAPAPVVWGGWGPPRPYYHHRPHYRSGVYFGF